MIAIAGGAGRLGRLLAAALVDRGEAVRVLTRDPARLPDELRGRVEVAGLDLQDPSTIGPALTGAQTVVSAVTGFGGPGAAGAAAIDGDGNLALIAAAEAAGATRFILLSVARAAPDSPVGLFRAKHAAEERLRASRLAWTIVRPTAYMETWIDMVGRPLAETGRTRVFGRGRNPLNFVSVGDVARIVEEIVVSDAFRGETITVAGPANLPMDEVAHAVERLTGRTGRIDHASPAVMRVMAAVLGVLRPVTADQVRAGVLMDTADMRMEPTDRLARFPGIPLTTLDEAVRRTISPSAAQMPAPSRA